MSDMNSLPLDERGEEFLKTQREAVEAEGSTKQAVDTLQEGQPMTFMENRESSMVAESYGSSVDSTSFGQSQEAILKSDTAKTEVNASSSDVTMSMSVPIASQKMSTSAEQLERDGEESTSDERRSDANLGLPQKDEIGIRLSSDQLRQYKQNYPNTSDHLLNLLSDTKTFTESLGLVSEMEAKDVTAQFFFEGQHKGAILVRNDYGSLGIAYSTASLDEIYAIIGWQRSVKVSILGTEEQKTITTAQFLKELKTPWTDRKNILNNLSCECSAVAKGLFTPPDVIGQIDLIERYWPAYIRHEHRKICTDGSFKATGTYPKNGMYVSATMRESFTTWHYDFGGCSVWNCLVYGRKVWWIAPPTAENMKLYDELQNAPTDANARRLAYELKDCVRFEMGPGDVLFLGSGWLHCVLTTEDTMMIGGNFFVETFIDRSLRTIQLDKGANEDYQLPNADELLYYVMAGVVRQCTTREYVRSYNLTNYDGDNNYTRVPSLYRTSGYVAPNARKLRFYNDDDGKRQDDCSSKRKAKRRKKPLNEKHTKYLKDEMRKFTTKQADGFAAVDSYVQEKWAGMRVADCIDRPDSLVECFHNVVKTMQDVLSEPTVSRDASRKTSSKVPPENRRVLPVRRAASRYAARAASDDVKPADSSNLTENRPIEKAPKANEEKERPKKEQLTASLPSSQNTLLTPREAPKRKAASMFPPYSTHSSNRRPLLPTQQILENRQLNSDEL